MKRKKSNSSSKKKKQTFLAVLTEIGKTVYYTAGDLGKRLVAWLKRIWKRFRALSMDKQRVVAALAVLVTSGLLFTVALSVGISACARSGVAEAEASALSNETDSAVPARALETEEDVADSIQADDTEDMNALTALPEAIEPAASEWAEESDASEDDPTEDASADAEPTPEPLVLKKHDEQPEVMNLQVRLIQLGYLEIDEPTEYYGSATEYAVKLFQRQHGLEMDGVAGTQTLELIYSGDAQKYTLKEGAAGRDVKMLQEQLVDLGYLSSKEVDSVYGTVTTEAVTAFQKRNKLTADGLAGEKTLEKLYSDSAKISAELAAKQKAEEEAAEKKAKEEAEKAAAKAKEEAAKAKQQSAKAKEEAAKKKEADKKAQEQAAKESRINKFISAANAKVGCEYVLGDRGPNTFDCSGFVWYCLKQAGVSTTRLNAAGYSGKSDWKEIKSFGSVQRGDILFFRSDESSRVSHTGIYIGNGMMIDASSGNGKVVKRAVSSYWKRNFVNARRPW